MSSSSFALFFSGRDQRSFLRGLLRAAVALAVLGGSGAALAVEKNNMTCAQYKLVSASSAGGVTKYEVSALCIIDLQSDSTNNYVQTTWGNLEVKGQYTKSSGKAREVVGFQTTSFYDNTNNTTSNRWNTPTAVTGSVQTADCAADPFLDKSHSGCKGHEHTIEGPFRDIVIKSIPFTYNGGALPYMFAALANITPQQANLAETKSAEAGLGAPEIVSPKNKQHFYSQEVHIRALVPASFKTNGQSCCRVELQKQAAGAWLPPMTLVKTNLDTVDWVLASADFTSSGYGMYRIRVAPNKENALDATVWTGYVEFGSWPKEVLEKPAITQPLANQAYLGASMPVQIKFPKAAKDAGVHCCDLQFQLYNNNAWADFKTETDTRLTDDGAIVQYDPNIFSAAGGPKARLRGRFIKLAGTPDLDWGDWREFEVATPKLARAEAGAPAAHGAVSPMAMTGPPPGIVSGQITSLSFGSPTIPKGGGVSGTVQGTGTCHVEISPNGSVKMGISGPFLSPTSAAAPAAAFPITFSYPGTASPGNYTVIVKAVGPGCSGQASAAVKVQ